MKKKIIFAVLLLIGLTCFAQTTQDSVKLPGDISLPSSKEELSKVAAWDKGNYKYSVEDFLTNSTQSGFQLSENGEYISYRERDKNGKRHVYVKNVQTGAVTKAIEQGDDLINEYFWNNANRLIFTKDQGGNENYQLFAVNIDGSNLKALTPFENVKVTLLRSLRDQKDHMIIEMNKDNPEVFEPYKINIVTGELVKLFENKDTQSPITAFKFDKDGKLRTITRLVEGKENQLFYRSAENAPFELVAKTNWKSAFDIMEFNYNSKNPHEAYVVSDLNSDKNQILRYDLKEKKVLEVLFKNDEYDINGFATSEKRNHEIDSYDYIGDKYIRICISQFRKDLEKIFQKAFNGKYYDITDMTLNEEKCLILVNSDKIVGEYHLLDIKTGIITKVADLRPQLKEEDMAEMRPIKFKSRDGLILHGYLTIPKGCENKKTL